MNMITAFYEEKTVPPMHWSILSAIIDPSKIQFSKSKLTDPHIQKILQYVSKVSGGKMKDIESYITREMAKFQINYQKAPLLYGTILENFVENEAFNLFEKTPPGTVATAPKFSLRVFNNLRARVQAEHSYMFPLKNKIDRLALKSEKYVFVPTEQKEDLQFNDITTAAATPTGTFIFSVSFCQKLLEYAHVKGLQPKGLKYQGGTDSFPPEWSYIEFLLLHEYMHYTQADWHYQKLYKASNILCNYAGDFRSNYELVKGGVPQLPMGLFSRDINYDCQRDMGEIIAVVKSEMDKLNTEEQQQVQKRMNQNSDDHGKEEKSEGRQSGEEGDGKDDGGKQDGGKMGDNGKSGKEPGTKPGKGKSKSEGNGGKNGGGENGTDPNEDSAAGPSIEEMNEHSKKANKQAAEGLEKSQTTESKLNKNEDADASGKSGKTNSGKGGNSDKPSEQFDYKSITPDFNWENLLRKFVKSTLGGSEETFTKMSRRSITSIDMAEKLGSAAVKPGEVDKLNKLKLLVVVDTSASMSEALPKINANLAALLSSNNPSLGKTFYLIRFSDNFRVYYCNMGTKDGVAIDPETFKPVLNAKRVTMDWLFSTAKSGGTEFTGFLKTAIEALIKQKYNVLIATDTDVLYGQNFINYGDLSRKNLKTVYTILDTQWSYQYAVQKFGMSPPNLTYFK